VVNTSGEKTGAIATNPENSRIIEKTQHGGWVFLLRLEHFAAAPLPAFIVGEIALT
jgi:hypothetical protein